MKRILPVLALLLVVACDNPTVAPTGSSGPVIEIASEFPIVGPYSFPEIDRAIDVAIMQHPTVDGYRLVHVSLDDSLAGAWNEDRMIQNIRRAVGESAIAGVIGPWTSQEAQFLIPQTAPASLAVISPSNTLDCLTDPSAPVRDRQTLPTTTSESRRVIRAARRRPPISLFASWASRVSPC
jgi:hypothetical protein